jgi:hypothetical protein
MAITTQPIPPDSVHVWRGYKIPDQTYDQFTKFLGSIFVPACTLIQPPVGLHAYVPSMPNQEGKPSDIPDQTGLMFWKEKDSYTNGFKTVAVRSYTSMHTLVYSDNSKSGFPIAFKGSVNIEQPYFLIDQPSDWMIGSVLHVVAGKKTDQTSLEFLQQVTAWISQYQANPSPGADGALVCVGTDYILLWEHFPEGIIPSLDHANALANALIPFLNKVADNTIPPAGLWDQWPGFDLQQQNCMNLQLKRPA